MTEQRMKEYFDIEVRKLVFKDGALLFETMIPLALAAKQNFEAV